jgi:hypothetical protein
MTKKTKYAKAIKAYESMKHFIPRTVKRIQYWGDGNIHGPDDIERKPAPSSDWHMLCNMEVHEYGTLLAYQDMRREQGKPSFGSLVQARRTCHEIQDAWYRRYQKDAWKDVSDDIVDCMVEVMERTAAELEWSQV